MTDSTGNNVCSPRTPVATTLNVLTTLSTVDLGNLDTTGFALGDDTITVTVSDASGNADPGRDRHRHAPDRHAGDRRR